MFNFQLEKEAVSKGVPVGQSIDIDIPPPRPKRKPSNPYPRKSGAATPTWSTSHVGEKDGKLVSSASSHSKLAVDLEIEELDEVIIFICLYRSNMGFSCSHAYYLFM